MYWIYLQRQEGLPVALDELNLKVTIRRSCLTMHPITRFLFSKHFTRLCRTKNNYQSVRIRPGSVGKAKSTPRPDIPALLSRQRSQLAKNIYGICQSEGRFAVHPWLARLFVGEV